MCGSLCALPPCVDPCVPSPLASIHILISIKARRGQHNSHSAASIAGKADSLDCFLAPEFCALLPVNPAATCHMALFPVNPAATHHMVFAHVNPAATRHMAISPVNPAATHHVVFAPCSCLPAGLGTHRFTVSWHHTTSPYIRPGLTLGGGG